MLLSVHAIEGSASAPTAEHQRRRPPTTGDRAGKQNRQFIAALAEPHLTVFDAKPHDLQERWCATLGLNLEPKCSSPIRCHRGHKRLRQGK